MTLAPGHYAPNLTRIDQRILQQLPDPDRPGRRVREIAEEVNYPGGRRRFESRAPVTDVDEVRGILRGFEHLGHARNRAGWWTRT